MQKKEREREGSLSALKPKQGLFLLASMAIIKLETLKERARARERERERKRERERERTRTRKYI